MQGDGRGYAQGWAVVAGEILHLSFNKIIYRRLCPQAVIPVIDKRDAPSIA